MVRHFEPMIYFREAGVALFKDITVLFWAGGSFFLKPEPPVFFARAARFFARAVRFLSQSILFCAGVAHFFKLEPPFYEPATPCPSRR